MNKSVKRNVSRMTKIAVLSAIAFMLTKFPAFSLAPFPSFLKMEVSDVAALTAGLSMGPVAGILVQLIKNLIDLVVNPVGAGVGQLANFTIGCAYVVPLSLIYRRTRKASGGISIGAGFAMGAVAGSVCMTLFACLFNYFVLVPLYAKAMDVEIKAFVDMTSAGIPLVTDFKTLIVFAFAPFNALKAVFSSVVGFTFYSALKPALKLGE